MKRTLMLAVYLVAFPLIGLLLGLIFFELMDLINGPLSRMAFYLSLVVWGGIGLFVGIYGTILMSKIDRLARRSAPDGDG